MSVIGHRLLAVGCCAVACVLAAPACGDSGERAIAVQVHASWFGYRHVSVRIEPTDPQRWRSHPAFRSDSSSGRLFATLGAKSRKISGKLVAKLNRRTDRRNHKTEVVAVDIGARSENEAIASLLDAEAGYHDDAQYRAFPKPQQQGYNSNSFVSGLLEAARLKPPVLTSRVRGYDVPVPVEYYDGPVGTPTDTTSYQDGHRDEVTQEHPRPTTSNHPPLTTN